MTTDSKPAANVREVVPFLWVSSMERSIRYYIDGLGFTMTHKWMPKVLRWVVGS